MKRMIFIGALALTTGLAALMAQQPAAPAKQMAPKSKGEQDALIAWQTALQAQNWDGVIKAADDFTTKYADSDFKTVVTYYEAVAYQQKKDPIKAQIYAEKTLEMDPKNFQALLMVGELIAKGTRDLDLDKDEKLAKAEKDLNASIEITKTGGKPNPGLTDEQWAQQQKYIIGEAEQSLGFVEMTRKNYDKAATHFKTANDSDPNPTYAVQLAKALQSGGKNDEAIAVVDKVLTDPQLNPVVKQVATEIKTAATQAKGGK